MIIKDHIKFILAAGILGICVILVYRHIFIDHNETYYSNKDFPDRILGWTAEGVIYDPDVLSSLSPDKIIYKSYQRNGSPQITLFMAYYNTLEKADLSHSPIVCFTGQGWEIEETTRRSIPINLPGMSEITVNHMIQKKLDTTMVALFWYQSAYSAFANRGIQKLSLFFDKLLGKSDNNAFIRLTIIVPPEMSVEETTTYLFSFVQALYPELRRFFIAS